MGPLMGPPRGSSAEGPLMGPLMGSPCSASMVKRAKYFHLKRVPLGKWLLYCLTR